MRMIGPRIAVLDTRSARPKKTADYHYLTPAHRAWRAEIIAISGGHCQSPACKTRNRKPSRLFADHIVELKDGGADLDAQNGQALCGSCHAHKTACARAARGATSS